MPVDHLDETRHRLDVLLEFLGEFLVFLVVPGLAQAVSWLPSEVTRS